MSLWEKLFKETRWKFQRKVSKKKIKEKIKPKTGEVNLLSRWKCCICIYDLTCLLYVLYFSQRSIEYFFHSNFFRPLKSNGVWLKTVLSIYLHYPDYNSIYAFVHTLNWDSKNNRYLWNDGSVSRITNYLYLSISKRP